jgi:hypothetical protein
MSAPSPARAKFGNLFRKISTATTPEHYYDALGELFQHCLENPELLSTDEIVRVNALLSANECIDSETCPNDLKETAERLSTMIRLELPQRANYFFEPTNNNSNAFSEQEIPEGGRRRRRKTRRSRKAKKTRRFRR